MSKTALCLEPDYTSKIFTANILKCNWYKIVGCKCTGCSEKNLTYL